MRFRARLAVSGPPRRARSPSLISVRPSPQSLPASNGKESLMRSCHALPLVAACALVVTSCGDEATAPTVEATSVAHFIPGHNTLRAKLREIVEENNGGLGFDMWATILDRDGRVVDV